MNVLSLFDGISCGQIALRRAGISYDDYYASEIDKYAIQVTQHNFPNTIQLGNVQLVHTKYQIHPNFSPGRLLGGSPCQGFSDSGKLLNFDDPRSKLFFEYIRLWKEVQPKYFLLENVMMRQSWQDIISDQLQTAPIIIDSRLVSARSRPRLYWTNIPVVGQPEDKNISYTDIVGEGFTAGAMRGRKIDPVTGVYDDALPYRQYIESRRDNKSNCLTTVAKDNVVIKSRGKRILPTETEYRFLTTTEYEKLQTIDVGYTACLPSDHRRQQLIGNSWTVDVIAFILSFMK